MISSIHKTGFAPAVAAVAVCAACGATANLEVSVGRDGKEADTESVEQETVEGWVELYGGAPPSVSLNSGEEAVWRELVERHQLDCSYDQRLSLAAREHARDLASTHGTTSDSDIDRIRFNLLRLGGIDYSIEAHVLPMGAEDRETLSRLGAERGSSWTHCGVGVSEKSGSGTAVWIGVKRLVSLYPVRVTSNSGAPVLINGRLLVKTKRPVETFIGLPDGTVEKLAPVQPYRNGRLALKMALHKTGRNDVELLVDTGRGPEVAALFPIYVGSQPDPLPVVTPDELSEDAQRAPDDALTYYLNSARERVGLEPLERDPRLDEAAAAHSEDMASAGFFGHVSSHHGPVDSRLTYRGMSPARLGENVARSSTALRIHRNLMASPSHRINLLDPEFTHVGIGVARDGNDLIVTEIFALWR